MDLRTRDLRRGGRRLPTDLRPSLGRLGRGLGGSALLAALGASALTACDDDVILRLPEPEVQVDELKQKPAALVDILWVVDNSPTMVRWQNALAANFDRFITGLTTCQGTGAAGDVCDFESKRCRVSGGPCNPPDYHIGVISTDMRSSADQGRLRPVGLCVPSRGATPANGSYRYCQASNADCQHDPQIPGSDPANGTCDMGRSITYVNPTTPSAHGAFGRAVRVGISGTGHEEGIQAAAAAVGRDTDRATGQWKPAPRENDGFLRPDASLFMIFVTDEDDKSFGELSYFYRAFETLKGAGNEGMVSISAIVGDPDIDGPEGTITGGCPAQAPIAEPGTRYIGLAMYSRGLSSELRTCDGKRLLCQSGERCEVAVPGVPGLCVPTTCNTDQDCGNFKCGPNDDTGCIACQAGSCSLQPQYLSELLEQNGIFGSICNEDYGPVLDALGFEAAGLARKFPLTKLPDCTGKVKCCAAGENEETCAREERVCVRVNGQPIPNERSSGWVYESSSNAVFFDGGFVPPTDAEITVAYRISKVSTALSCDSGLN